MNSLRHQRELFPTQGSNPATGPRGGPAARALGLAAISLSLFTRPAATAAPAPPGAQQPAPSGQLASGPTINSQPPPNVVNTPVPPPVLLPGLPQAQSVVPVPADQTNRPLTADEAGQIALARQPSIAAAGGQVTVSRGVIQQERSGLLPTLGLRTAYAHAERLKGSAAAAVGVPGAAGSRGSIDQFQASATVSQLIYNFNHTRELVRQARAQERAAGQNLSATQQDVVQQVKEAFYQYVQSRQLVDVNQQNVANRQSQLALVNARYRIGVGLASDVANAQTAVSEAVQNLTQAQNTASVAQVTLAQLMGIDPRTPIQPAETGEPPLASTDVNGFVQAALRQRPEVLREQATVQANQHALKAARTFNAPALSGNLGFNGLGPQFFPQNQAFTVGVALQFDPFDGGLTAGLTKQARGNLATAQAQLVSQQIAVATDVSQAYLNFRSAEQRVTAAGTEVTNAREGVRIAAGRYQAGIGQFQDVLTAQQALYTALSNQVNSQGALATSRVAFDRAVGSPVAAATRG
jgi:outer membrane protein